MHRRVQKLKCNVVSHACKHKPDSHILPYWSDRACRRLAENTNTAWGDCLKLETSFLSTVFFCCGNHLAVGASQSLESAPCPFPDSAPWLFKESHSGNFWIICSNPSLRNRFRGLFVFCFFFWVHKPPFCFFGQVYAATQVQEASLFWGLSSMANPHFQSAQNRSQVCSVADNYSGTVTGIPSSVIPGWPLLCLSAIPANNTAQ